MNVHREREVHIICISYLRQEQRSQTRRRWKTCLGLTRRQREGVGGVCTAEGPADGAHASHIERDRYIYILILYIRRAPRSPARSRGGVDPRGVNPNSNPRGMPS